MTGPQGRPEVLARAHHADEEVRYRAVLELDAARPEELRELFARLDDESWRVRTGAVERISMLDDPTPALPLLLEALDGGDSIGGRDAAAAALARIGAPAVPAVIERLASAEPGVRLAAVALLGAIGDRRAVTALTARLADADPNMRAAAAEGLGKLGGADAATSLLAALDSDDSTLRGSALDALVLLQVTPPADQLTRLLGDRPLRRAIYRTLGSSVEPGAQALLIGGLAERSRLAREAALWAIGQLRTRRAAADLAPLARQARELAIREPAIRDACAAALASEEPFVAVGALVTLSWIGEVRHAAAMAPLAEDDRYRPLVEEAFDALPRGPELAGALAEVLPGLPPMARITAWSALAQAGDPAAFEALVERAGDADPQVQAEAIAALGRIGDPRAVSSLGGLLGDGAPAVAGVAASALIGISQRSPEARGAVLTECRARAGAGATGALYRILAACGEREDLRRVRAGLSGGGAVRRVAAAAAVAILGHRGLLEGEPLPELVAALSDLDWSVRAAAARAFSELARATAAARTAGGGHDVPPLGAEAIQGLVRALADPEPAVRAAALEALGADGRPEHVERIAAVAAEPDAPPLVAVAALRALTRLGVPIPAAVERGMAHRDPEVVKEAVAAAALVPGEAGRRLLRLAAGSARWDVRHAAAQAMAARGDEALREQAARLATTETDPMVARAFADAAQALSGRSGRG